jgi:hypothetical protein
MDTLNDGDVRRLATVIEQQQIQLSRLDAAIVERKQELKALQRDLEYALHQHPRRFT